MSQLAPIRSSRQRFRYPEINHLHRNLRRVVCGRRQHHVGRLQIAMDQPALGRFRERGGDLPRNLDDSADIKRAGAAHALVQGFAFDQFHRVKALAALFVDPELIDGGDIRVPQRRRRARFAHESFTRFGASVGEIGLDDFQRDLSLQ
ncbi:MAG: hypothetical protein ABI016_09395 [Chthoniobacterales bacterium]